eukprot:s2017_g10.t1
MLAPEEHTWHEQQISIANQALTILPSRRFSQDDVKMADLAAVGIKAYSNGRANIGGASAVPTDPDPKLEPAPVEEASEDMVEYDEQGERFKAWRDVCREWSRKCQLRETEREAVFGLNWMAGKHDFLHGTEETPDLLQTEVLQRIHTLAAEAGELGSLEHVPAPEAALRELLKGRSDYHQPDIPVALAPYRIERDDTRRYLQGEELMLKDGAIEDAPRPYWDPGMAMSRSRPRDDAEQALSRCQPGQRLAVWYNDDDVYHERVLVWRVDGKSWYVLTPDKDLYVEDFSGLGENGPVSFKVKDDDFRYWSRLGKPVYRF